VRLNCNYDTEIRKEGSYVYRDKIPNIILKTVRAVKIYNLFIQQALKFNMNYRALSGYCKKS